MFPIMSKNMRRVYVTPDGTRIVSGDHDGGVKVWDMATGEEVCFFRKHRYAAECICVSPDGTRVISGSCLFGLYQGGFGRIGEVLVWDVNTGENIHVLRGHTQNLSSVCVTPDGTRIVSASEDNTVKVWDMETGEELRTLNGHTNTALSICVTPDGTRIVSGSGDNTVKVWDMETGEELRTLTGHTDWVHSVCVTPDGTRIVSAS